MTLDPGDLDRVVRAALEEDLRYGPDVTTAAVIPSGTTSVADIVARQPGTLAGLLVVAAVLDVACPAATFTPQARDGDRVAAGAVVARVDGPLAEILTAERTLLNFLTHLSGIATATRAWVDAIDGTGALVRDTRKTIPGLRVLEKYAVRCGGGVNHRMGLGDAALIKDNHIAAAGGVTAAFRAVLAAAPGVVTEVECDTLDQVGQALAAGAALILLDNMSPDQMRSAVAMARAYPAARLEASGGLRLENAREVAGTGVHYLSVGALTHSSPALDLALDVGLSADGCQLPRPQDARTGDGRAMAEQVANYTRADVTKRERPLVTGARVPVVTVCRRLLCAGTAVAFRLVAQQHRQIIQQPRQPARQVELFLQPRDPQVRDQLPVPLPVHPDEYIHQPAPGTPSTPSPADTARPPPRTAPAVAAGHVLSAQLPSTITAASSTATPTGLRDPCAVSAPGRSLPCTTL
jgi:nicotinate-nucleotide pyrophosphorylase (carboxylating)